MSGARRRAFGAMDALWKEEDVIDGRRVGAMVAILRTRGCWWARAKGCLMCGYNEPEVTDVGIDDLRAQLAKAVDAYDGEGMVKVYTSGSFLDDNEIPPEFRKEFVDAFPEAELVLVESRPEFVTHDALAMLPPDRTAVAIGLESADDRIRRTHVRKGFTFSDFERAALLLRDEGFRLRTYLLLKPPFLGERRSLEDAVSSVAAVADLTWDVSVNPVNVQRGTLVERLWRRGDYRPPWTWSLVEVLRRSAAITDRRVFSSPSGAGTKRGVHGCKECDRRVISAIEEFSMTQDPSALDIAPCECQARWSAQLDMEEAMFTSVDIDRHINDELAFP